MDKKPQTATQYQLAKQSLYFISMLEAHQKAMFEIFDVSQDEERHFHAVFNDTPDTLLKERLTIQYIEDTMSKNKLFL